MGTAGLSKLTAIFILIILVLLIGAGYGLYASYNATESLKVNDVKLVSFSARLTGVDILLNLKLHNPSEYHLSIRELSYTIFVNDVSVASGEKLFLLIPARRDAELPITIRITAADAVRMVLSSMNKDRVNLRLSLSGKIPLTLFNIIELPLNVPFAKDLRFTVIPSKRAVTSLRIYETTYEEAKALTVTPFLLIAGLILGFAGSTYAAMKAKSIKAFEGFSALSTICFFFISLLVTFGLLSALHIEPSFMTGIILMWILCFLPIQFMEILMLKRRNLLVSKLGSEVFKIRKKMLLMAKILVPLGVLTLPSVSILGNLNMYLGLLAALASFALFIIPGAYAGIKERQFYYKHELYLVEYDEEKMRVKQLKYIGKLAKSKLADMLFALRALPVQLIDFKTAKPRNLEHVSGEDTITAELNISVFMVYEVKRENIGKVLMIDDPEIRKLATTLRELSYNVSIDKIYLLTYPPIRC